MYLNVFSIIRRKTKRFRPLIRGFFFYRIYTPRRINKQSWRFPSPHSGILFLFYITHVYNRMRVEVSVPSFGDSFFIDCKSVQMQII